MQKFSERGAIGREGHTNEAFALSLAIATLTRVIPLLSLVGLGVGGRS
jgi:hypothetical protein